MEYSEEEGEFTQDERQFVDGARKRCWQIFLYFFLNSNQLLNKRSEIPSGYKTLHMELIKKKNP